MDGREAVLLAKELRPMYKNSPIGSNLIMSEVITKRGYNTEDAFFVLDLIENPLEFYEDYYTKQED